MPSSNERVAVIGSGNFGTAVANLLAENKRVLMYCRSEETVARIMKERINCGQPLHPHIEPSADLAYIAKECKLLFPIIASYGFRETMQKLAPYVYPDHIIIHGTKGLDVRLAAGETLATVEKLQKHQIKTMSEVIREECITLRIGCIAGPNLAREIAAGQPAATVVSSRFDEVIREGQAALKSSRFRAHSNYDILGVELGGVLKNIIAIGAGLLNGLQYGDNTKALLVTRGMAEMAIIGKHLGANPKTFLGLAGIGDLVATCASSQSRNFTVGYRIGKGETLQQVMGSLTEVAEGVNTIRIVQALCENYRIPAVITRNLHRILYEGMSPQEGMTRLMEYRFSEDIDFI